MALRLTMAFSDNPRVQPLKDGAVKPQGIDLNCVTIEPGTLFFRNLMYDEFDVFEMSISETLLAIERRDVGRWDWSALPVFLSRAHHWPNFWVNTASGIRGLADIRGKRGRASCSSLHSYSLNNRWPSNARSHFRLLQCARQKR